MSQRTKRLEVRLSRMENVGSDPERPDDLHWDEQQEVVISPSAASNAVNKGPVSRSTDGASSEMSLLAIGDEVGSASDDEDDEFQAALLPPLNQHLKRPSRDDQRAVSSFKVPPFEMVRAYKFFVLCKDRFVAIGIYDPNLRSSCIMEYLPSNLVEMLTQRHHEFSESPNRYLALGIAMLEFCTRPF